MVIFVAARIGTVMFYHVVICEAQTHPSGVLLFLLLIVHHLLCIVAVLPASFAVVLLDVFSFGFVVVFFFAGVVFVRFAIVVFILDLLFGFFLGFFDLLFLDFAKHGQNLSDKSRHSRRILEDFRSILHLQNISQPNDVLFLFISVLKLLLQS